jgi:hemerythrin
MALLQWNDAFAVGIAAVDHEHQEMIALINELHATLVRDRSDPAVEEFLGEVHTRIAAHFALEEKLMRESHYDEFEAHKVDHEDLLDDIREIMDAYDMDPELDEEAFSRRLETWFSEHFKTHDARLHQRLG